jgi:hypothetical protein
VGGVSDPEIGDQETGTSGYQAAGYQDTRIPGNQKKIFGPDTLIFW